MKKLIISFLTILLFAFSVAPTFAQSPQPTPEDQIQSEPNDSEVAVTPVSDQYLQAKVVQIESDTTSNEGGYPHPVQTVKLQILTGSEKGKEIELDHGSLFTITNDQKVKQGEVVVVTKTKGPSGDIYYITDKYRIEPLLIIFGLFFLAVVILGKWKGVTSIAGLILSILILIQYVIPKILAGGNPLTISLIGSLAIAILSIYMAHGLSRRTTLALASTIVTLCLAALMSLAYVSLTFLSGTGSEEAIFLQMGPFGTVDLKGLLLGGIIIGTLGILDDITISQTVAIDEIRLANPKLSWRELFKRGIRIGQEHVASLVNTLALAYVGASFPLLLLFSASQEIPFWLTLNSEFIIEELVRTLVGSTALVLAVPISSLLAAYFLANRPKIKTVAISATKTTKKKKAAKKTTRRRTTTRTRRTS